MRSVWFLLLMCLRLLTFSQNRYSVVIDEIMADPTPPTGLPEKEWVELKNTTASAIHLAGWHIGDGSGQSAAFPDFWLDPDNFVIVCASGAAGAMSAFGPVVAVSAFPSLDNIGGLITLQDANANIIHAVEYSNSWYQNELKQGGGWTLEMIDTNKPCLGMDNWKASSDPRGGTPGQKNSIDGLATDQAPPALRYVYVTDSVTIVAVFDEPLDSIGAGNANHYSIDGISSISNATPLAPLFSAVKLKLIHPLLHGAVVTLTVGGITDCNHNPIGTSNHARTGMPSESSALDIVVNEILFHPPVNGYDYVEFYNRSNKIIDASGLFVANRSASGDIASIRPLYPTPFFMLPGDYFVITENKARLETNYLVRNPEAVIQLPSLPSFPNDKGDVILLNDRGELVDEVPYDEDWQFKLMVNDEGVSLERIDPDGPSGDKGNWHSASSTAGYGTPTYQNSQYKATPVGDATVLVDPKIFSPDNDGHDDVTAIRYSVTEPGFIANVIIFDAQGRPVRHLAKNGTLGLTGLWNWDGLDENGSRLPIGIYIVYTEIFNLQGKVKHFKNAVVLARKLN